MRQCYACGYLLYDGRPSSRCSECGCANLWSVLRNARASLFSPELLFLTAVLTWRRMPEALWRAGVRSHIIGVLRKSRSRVTCFWTLVALLLLFFVGPFRVTETYMARVPLDQHGMQAQWFNVDGIQAGSIYPEEVDGPWITIMTHDVLGENRRMAWLSAGRDDVTRYALASYYFDYQVPRFTCATPLPRYRDWALYPVYSVIVGEDEGWSITPAISLIDLRRTFMLVFLPLLCWQFCVLILRLLSRLSLTGATSTCHELDRRAALIAISRAAFVPVRITWIGAFLLVVPFLAAPNATHSFRSAAFWVLLFIGTAGPPIVMTRAWCADQVFRIARGRFVPSAALLVIGCILPATIGVKIIYAVTYYIGSAAYRALESRGSC